MHNSNSGYPYQQQQPYRGRVGPDGAIPGSPYSGYAQQPLNPPTPPLVFTAQLGGTPPQQPDPFTSSPYVEPLQVNYQAVLGRHNSRTMIEVEDSPIKVTCRARGGARSPYVTPTLGDVTTEAYRSGRHNPYTFSYSGNSSPMQCSTPTHPPATSGFVSAAARPFQQMERPAPNAHLTQGHSVQLEPTFELPPEVVHRSLKDRCRYIQFPANLPVFKASTLGGNASGPNSNSNGSTGSGQSADTSNSLPIALFIGQVRFETTAAELLWLVHRTCGACASHLESRGAGCYLLYCKSEADLTLVRSLHKRILFDVGGVWLARTADEVDAMCEYIALDAPLLSKKARLPRDSMVVEELKADAIHNGNRRGHGAGGQDKRTASNHSVPGQRRGGGGSVRCARSEDMSQGYRGEPHRVGSQAQQQPQPQPPQGLPPYSEHADQVQGDCPPYQQKRWGFS